MNPADVTLPSQGRALRWVLGCLVAVVVIGVYSNSFRVPFLYDDATAVANNPSLHSLWPLGPVLDPPAHQTTSGRPLVNLSLALNYAFGGLEVPGYHGVNLVIHLAAGLVLAGLVRLTLMGTRLRGTWGSRADWVAACVALLWLLHPLQTESVTYVVQRAESLMALFYLLTLYAFARAVSEGDKLDGHRGWLAVSLLSCFLGAACKEVMVTAPVLVLLYDRTFVADWKDLWARRRGYYLGLSLSWGILAGLAMMTGGTRDGSAGFGGPVSVGAYAGTQAVGVLRYLKLAVWPSDLVFDYGHRPLAVDALMVASICLVLGLLGWAVLALGRRSVSGFLVASVFLVLAPTSSLMPISTEVLAEHRMYLPLAAIVTLTVVALFRTVSRVQAVIVVGVAAIALGAATHHRNEVYRSPETLWGDTVAKRPDNARARNQYGYALFLNGHPEAAQRQFEAALALEPDTADAHYNLATALLHFGRNEEAIREYERTLALAPVYPGAQTNLGLAYVQEGKPDAAIAHYEAALSIDGPTATTLNDLGVAFAETGRLKEALSRFARAVQVSPDYAEAFNNLGNAELQLGSPVEAARDLTTALVLEPDYAEAHNNLAKAYEGLGRRQEAAAQYREVLRLSPDYAAARLRLAVLSSNPSL